jgi:hypothetical protein
VGKTLKQMEQEARRARIAGYFVPKFIIKWRLKAKERSIYAAYRPEIEEAMKSQNEEGFRSAVAVREFQASYYSDQIKAMEAGRLIRRAKRQLLEIPVDSSVWVVGHFGERWLSPEAFRKLALELRAVERETWKHRREWATVALSLAAFMVALWSVANTQKRISGLETRVDASDANIRALSASGKVVEEWLIKHVDEARARGQQQPSRQIRRRKDSPRRHG